MECREKWVNQQINTCPADDLSSRQNHIMDHLFYLQKYLKQNKTNLSIQSKQEVGRGLRTFAGKDQAIQGSIRAATFWTNTRALWPLPLSAKLRPHHQHQGGPLASAGLEHINGELVCSQIEDWVCRGNTRDQDTKSNGPKGRERATTNLDMHQFMRMGNCPWTASTTMTARILFTLLCNFCIVTCHLPWLL
jgi:hypothetical protein